MERDPEIRKLIKEKGLETPSGDFTEKVMYRIGTKPANPGYRPLIGKTGRVLIMLFIVAVVVISLLYSGQGGMLIEKTLKPGLPEWNWPQFNFDLEFLSRINFSPWLVSTVVALFLLILTDAGVRRKKMT